MSDSSQHIDFKLYRYTPSVAAAAIFITLFIVTTVFHLWQLIKSRSWYFIAFVFGGICECFTEQGFAYAVTGIGHTMLTITIY
jgi:hypothetical protein